MIARLAFGIVFFMPRFGLCCRAFDVLHQTFPAEGISPGLKWLSTVVGLSYVYTHFANRRPLEDVAHVGASESPSSLKMPEAEDTSVRMDREPGFPAVLIPAVELPNTIEDRVADPPLRVPDVEAIQVKIPEPIAECRVDDQCEKIITPTRGEEPGDSLERFLTLADLARLRELCSSPGIMAERARLQAKEMGVGIAGDFTEFMDRCVSEADVSDRLMIMGPHGFLTPHARIPLGVAAVEAKSSVGEMQRRDAVEIGLDEIERLKSSAGFYGQHTIADDLADFIADCTFDVPSA